MNTPNKLTLFRIIITPIFMVFLIYNKIPHHFLFSFIIFALASITDFFDGKLARKNNQITNLGKLLDPLADKMLTTAALLGFFKFNLCSIWVLMIILTREFAVTGVRMVASVQNVVIPANIWGKIKTASQMIFSCAIIAAAEINAYHPFISCDKFDLISNLLMWVTAVFAIVSGIIYIIQGRKIIDFSK